MNAMQLAKIEQALLGALSWIQTHPPEHGKEALDEEHQRVISDLRSATMLLRTWMAMCRRMTSDTEDDLVLPGQLRIPGCEEPQKS